MSRLLLLLPSMPTTLDSGARIRNLGLLRLLATDHEVDVLVFGDDPSALAGVVHMVKAIAPPPARSASGRLADLARSNLPDMALRLWSREFAAEVQRAIQQTDYDAVQAEGIEMAGYLGLVPPEQRVYDAHNAEFLLQRRLASLAPSLAGRLYSRLQWRRLERFERQVVATSRMTLGVSEHDANQLLALAGADADVRVIRNGIDVPSFPYLEPTADQPPNVLFVGKLDFRPNAEAVRWFVSDVLQCLDGVRLFAVGAAPPDWLVNVGQRDDRVAVTGHVADERPYLRRCMALVLPITTGGGSRLKALIAMASGLPIVSTRVGMEGLDAEPGRHFLAADTADEFAACIRRLAEDLELRRGLARQARALVETRYDWSAIRGDLRAAYAWLET